MRKTTKAGIVYALVVAGGIALGMQGQCRADTIGVHAPPKEAVAEHLSFERGF